MCTTKTMVSTNERRSCWESTNQQRRRIESPMVSFGVRRKHLSNRVREWICQTSTAQRGAKHPSAFRSRGRSALASPLEAPWATFELGAVPKVPSPLVGQIQTCQPDYNFSSCGSLALAFHLNSSPYVEVMSSLRVFLQFCMVP